VYYSVVGLKICTLHCTAICVKTTFSSLIHALASFLVRHVHVLHFHVQHFQSTLLHDLCPCMLWEFHVSGGWNRRRVTTHYWEPSEWIRLADYIGHVQPITIIRCRCRCMQPIMWDNLVTHV